MGARTQAVVRQVRAYTLCQLESAPGLLGSPPSCSPRPRPKKTAGITTTPAGAPSGACSGRALIPRPPAARWSANYRRSLNWKRDRHSPRRMAPTAAPRPACPWREFPKALAATAQAADQLAPPLCCRAGPQGRRWLGSYLAGHAQKPSRLSADPVCRSTQLSHAAHGGALLVAQRRHPRRRPGRFAISRIGFASWLAKPNLVAGDILLGDRGFGSFPVIAWLKYGLSCDFIGRTTRRVDGRAAAQTA